MTGTASGTGAWIASGIPVAEGNTTIVIRAYDAKGASANGHWRLVRQSGRLSTPQSPPAISLRSPRNTSNDDQFRGKTSATACALRLATPAV